MPEIESASRRIPKATYVPILVAQDIQRPGGAVQKFGYVRQLSLQHGEVDLVRQSLSTQGGTPLAKITSLVKTLRAFEGSPMPSGLPSPKAFANVPTDTLVAFGQALVAVRQSALQPQTAAGSGKPRTQPTLDPAGAMSPTDYMANGNALYLVNQALVATNAFVANVAASPIGMLNLERIEMTPAGIERGELIATVPLAPKEKTSVTQKEWSVTSQEFTSIVTDSLENYSETGVTENTDLSQSTTSQTDHSNQFNINSSVSGSYGLVTASVAATFGVQDKTSDSAKDSRNHAISVTRKASSRVKQEHKTTIKTSTITGTSETTTRTLQNPSATDPIRIDYFSMMRKWRVRLYRYGLRLTYDIAIPEPGGALREMFRSLDLLQKQAAAGFSFQVPLSDVTDEVRSGEMEPHYQVLGDLYGVALAAPPDATRLLPQIGGVVGGLYEDDNWRYTQVGFDVPDQYEVADTVVIGDIGSNGQLAREFKIVGYGNPWGSYLSTGDSSGNGPSDLYWPLINTPGTGQNFLAGGSGHETITYRFRYVGVASILFNVTVQRMAVAYNQWQIATWSTLYNAAQTKYFATQQALQAQITALQDQINNVDTLTLRREESDEIMKGVLRWLLGTGFDFMPPNVQKVFTEQVYPGTSWPINDIQYGVSFTGNEIGISPDSWTTMFQYQEMVKFINEAIEWENVLYFLYSYFWDVPASWDFIRRIEHSDKTRQAFLRAGSARIVLPVRKGYETRWTSFVELGDLQSQHILPAGSTPYMTIAQEIQNYDDTNYPGIPAANPGGPTLNDGPEVVAACKLAVSASPSAVTLAVDSSAGFVVGAMAIVDTPESGDRESQQITAIPDATHISLQRLVHPHDGTATPFPVVQQGEQGLLIAEWYEYTPTSGIDIAMTSNLATIG